MNMFLIDQAVVIRIGLFLGIFLCMATWEVRTPRRARTQNKLTRWANNLGLTFLNALLLQALLPLAAVGVALIAAEKGWGLFHQYTIPLWFEGLASIIVLDLAIYSQHIIFHKIPLFWRLHRMHHTDLDFDVTTGARFHPLEIILSMLIKMGIVFALGAPAWSVIIFEILLNGTSMFNHSNINIKTSTDGLLRLLVVTPDMHRVHHSVRIRETESNFGFNFPWWDRLFQTYQAQPAAGHINMTIGLANYQDPKWLQFPWMLVVPFARHYR